MKNYSLLFKTMMAMTMVCLFASVSLGQCVIPVTPQQPFIEDFDGDFLTCWTVESVGGGQWAQMTGSTGSAVAAFSFTEAGDEARLISPTLDLSGSNSAVFNFSYAMMGLYENDELVVSYRLAESDPWQDLGTFSVSDWVNTYEQNYELTEVSSTLQVSFLGRGLGGYYIFIDRVEVSSIMGCARPVGLNATQLTAFSAQLDWSSTGNEDHWLLEMNGETIKVDELPYQATDLTPQTEYTCRVMARCNESLESEWSTPYTFKTLCDVITVTDDAPYYDDFDASDEFICWYNEVALGQDGWVIDPGYLILNNTAFFIWLGVEAQLVSAPLDISAVTKPILTFKRRQPLSPEYVNDELSVWYLTNDDIVWRLLGRFPNPAEDWEDVKLDLPSPTGRYQIAFLARSHDGDGVYVDNVFVGNDPDVSVAETKVLCAMARPNPAQETLVLSANVAEATAAVFDVFGRKVAEVVLNEGQATLNLNGYAPGMYVARIACETGVTTLRFIKE